MGITSPVMTLTGAFATAGLSAVGLSGPYTTQGDGSNPTQSWHLHAASSQWFRVDWPSVPTAGQVSSADGVIQATDLSPGGLAAAENLQKRSVAKTAATGPEPPYKLQRAVLIAILTNALNAINALRQRDVDRAADVAAATSLNDLKARWAARPALNPIDLSAAIAAVKADVVSQINAGNAD